MTAAFTFPGQGSQAVGMGKALAEVLDLKTAAGRTPATPRRPVAGKLKETRNGVKSYIAIMPSQLGPTECPASGLTSRMIDTGTAAFAYTFISAISSRLGSRTWEMIELHGG